MRLTVETLAINTIDVRELKRLGVLDRDCVISQASWRWPRLQQMRVSKHALVLEFYRQATPQTITVSWTRCFFGGERPWLHCSHCDRRVARLFRGMGGYWCRVCCGNPIYESQRRSKKARAYLRASRIRQLIDGSRPVIDPLPPRSRGMRRRTHGQLCATLLRLERPLVGSRVVKLKPAWIPPLAY